MAQKKLRHWKVLAAAAVAAALAVSGCSGGTAQKPSGDGKQMLTVAREDTATFTRNFNPFSPNVAPMTQQAIYESMLVYNPAKGNVVPWLATKWTPDPHGTGLTFTLRPGVQWSDGKPLVAGDVVETFTLQKKLLGGFDYVKTVTAVDDHTVKFVFNRPYSPALYELGQQIIVPAHVWSTIADPSKELNPTPVGSGPYTEVSNFQTQYFDLTKNPHYWQPDKQGIAGIRMLAFAGNDGANLAAQTGDVDWAPQYMPNIQKTFVDKNPQHNHYWFPATGGTINWQLNTKKAPFNDVNVRKALSMSLDRDQIAKIGMSGYTHPADCTGLSDAYLTWKDSTLAAGCTWTKLDVAGANALLDKAGYVKGSDGQRKLKDGSPFTFKISVGSTSSDWLSVCNIIAQDLQQLGITAKVAAPDWATVVSGYQEGTFDTGIVWSNSSASPYQFFDGVMGSDQVKPVGTSTDQNYHRFGLPAADALLTKFTATADDATEHQIVNQLQALYNDNAPVVPLFPGPAWGAYTDIHFTGWPSATDPYATLDTRAPTTVLVLTSLKPVK